MLAVRWYLRFGLSYRDVEELLAERGVEVDHVTLYRWVQRFTPLLVEAARPCRHAVGDRWFVDETYVKVAGRGGTSTEPSTSSGRSSTCSSPRGGTPRPPAGSSSGHRPTKVRRSRLSPTRRRCFRRAGGAAASGWHGTDRYANNRIEADHGRLKARLRPMRGSSGPQRQGGHRRPCLRPEPPARPLRAGGRPAAEPAAGGRVRRTRPGDLIPS